MFEQTQNQRQAGDPLRASVLNVLQVGVRQGSPEDARAWELACAHVSTRLLRSAGGTVDDAAFQDAPRLFARTEQVRLYNEACLRALQSTGVEVLAVEATHDAVPVPGRPTAAVNNSEIPESPDICGGLDSRVQLAVGARIMLLHTLDGLVNGAQGLWRCLYSSTTPR